MVGRSNDKFCAKVYRFLWVARYFSSAIITPTSFSSLATEKLLNISRKAVVNKENVSEEEVSTEKAEESVNES